MYSVVGSDGQVYGPVDMKTLQQWIVDGRVIPTTNLIDPIDGRVLQAQHAPSLFDAFPQRLAAPPVHVNPGPPPGFNMAVGQTPIQININNQPQAYPYAPYPAGVYGPPKSRVVALLLAFFLGALGIHRFYLGRSGTGVAMLLLTVLTCGYGAFITGIWAIVDMVLIATGGLPDANNQPLGP